jgi:hypothetical protein
MRRLFDGAARWAVDAACVDGAVVTSAMTRMTTVGHQEPLRGARNRQQYPHKLPNADRPEGATSGLT